MNYVRQHLWLYHKIKVTFHQLPLYMIPITTVRTSSLLPPPTPCGFDHVDRLEHVIENERVFQCWGRFRIKLRTPLLEQEDQSRNNQTFGECFETFFEIAIFQPKLWR